MDAFKLFSFNLEHSAFNTVINDVISQLGSNNVHLSIFELAIPSVTSQVVDFYYYYYSFADFFVEISQNVSTAILVSQVTNRTVISDLHTEEGYCMATLKP